MGELDALQGVRRYPVRIKCASLPWTTLVQAVSQSLSACFRINAGHGARLMRERDFRVLRVS